MTFNKFEHVPSGRGAVFFNVSIAARRQEYRGICGTTQGKAHSSLPLTGGWLCWVLEYRFERMDTHGFLALLGAYVCSRISIRQYVPQSISSFVSLCE